MLWIGVASAPWLALVLLPVELVFWIGFALPFGFVFGWPGQCCWSWRWPYETEEWRLHASVDIPSSRPWWCATAN
jgi:hypothetical protein